MGFNKTDAVLPPTGIVTFMLTDIEGSTRLWESHPKSMPAVLARLDEILTRIVDANNGYLPKSQGEGDSSLSAFAAVTEAINAASQLQLSLAKEAFPDGPRLRLRIALHTGESDVRNGDYFGLSINRCARLRALAHGRQILISGTTFERVKGQLPAPLFVADLGTHRLKDLSEPEHIFQLNHPDLPSDFPPLRSIATAMDNLPTPLTSYVGREKELGEVKQRLLDHRLVTVTGTAGVGKSRLAREVASDLLREFLNGVWLVDIEGLGDDEVPQAVASALRLEETQSADAMARVFNYLRPRKTLLVLDGCERTVTGCAVFAKAALEAAPNLRILITSRDALNISGEALYPLGPLTLPSSSEDLLNSEAVKLYLERARLVQPEFSFTEENGDQLERIIRRLDGLPLAIELAAARVNVLTLEQIDQRLSESMSLLSSASSEVKDHHQSLAAALDWSFDVLSAHERSLLMRLSIFRGGFDLEAAEAVCSDGELPGSDILNLLSSLIGRSLIASESSSASIRFRLLEPIRQHAADGLAKIGATEYLHRKHTEWFTQIAEQANTQMRGPNQKQWAERLDDEQQNLRVAIEQSIEKGSKEESLRLPTALARYWYTRGLLTEGRRWLGRALGKQGDAPHRLMGSALGSAAALARAQGDYQAAEPLYEESLVNYQQTGDQTLISWGFRSLAALAQERGRYKEAHSLYEESLGISRRVDDELGIVESLHGLGGVLQSQGELAAAKSMRQEALQMARHTGDRWALGVALNDLGWLLQLMDDPLSAESVHKEALSTFEDLGGPWGAAFARLGLAQIARTKGQTDEWAELAESAIQQAAEIGDDRVLALGYSLLAHARRVGHRFSDSADLIIEAIRLGKDNPESGVVVRILDAAAVLAADLGACVEAARFLGGLDRIRSSQVPLTALDKERVSARARCAEALGKGIFEQEVATGGAMSPLELFTYAEDWLMLLHPKPT